MKQIVLFYPKLEPDKPFHYVPYSALCVASRLVFEGHSVKIIDERVDDIPDFMNTKVFDSVNEVWISVYTGYQVTRAYRFSKLLKLYYPEIKIVWGGPHVTAFPQQTLNADCVDDVYCGYFERGEYPMAWDLVDLNKYINPSTERFIYISSYGCVGICTFCSQKNNREWIEIPITKVEDDIDRLMKMYQYKECVFFDATIFTRPQRAFDISKLMKKHNLKWVADARADEIIRMSSDTLDSIMDSGVTQLTIGLESGSQRVVDLMKKGRNHLENYKKCAEIMAKYKHVRMCSGVIFGCPSETPNDIIQTIDYIKQIKAINTNFYISTTFFMPLPNTEMADMAKKYGYEEPTTLEEWAVRGQQGHFSYNSWMNNPWIENKEEYKKIYDDFILECDYLI